MHIKDWDMEKNLHGLGRHHFGVHTAVPEQKSDLTDTAERGDTHALLLLIGRKMGIEIWAQTHTRTTLTHTQNRKPPKKSHNRHKTALGREWLILSPRCEPGSFSSSVSEFH
ncbi:hypothetical protein H0G86_006907 [Trichoderma simmonsii]|uniref:Uncharacterized protein n=1 Tax=Trichoderma simmonsii TaxID=1491479 RepID=A0A8G0LCV7_9HYPO|nr:hypothetical protein H0G86_006907 [Trichoderma simmonsii]